MPFVNQIMVTKDSSIVSGLNSNRVVKYGRDFTKQKLTTLAFPFNNLFGIITINHVLPILNSLR